MPIEFATFAIDFVPFAVEFVVFAIEFDLFVIEFISFAMNSSFAIHHSLEFIAVAHKFDCNKIGSCSKHENSNCFICWLQYSCCKQLFIFQLQFLQQHLQCALPLVMAVVTCK